MDEKLRRLERAWKRSGDPRDGEAYLRERLRVTEDLVLKLVRHVARLEDLIPAIRGISLPDVRDVLDWLDDDWPHAPPPRPEPPPPRPALPVVTSLEINRGFSEEWLRARCGCGHLRGYHDRLPSEERGPCLICECQRFRV